jgi:beta-1,4-mannosyltransferase
MKILASPAFSNKKSNPYNSLLYSELGKNGIEIEDYSHQKLTRERHDVVHYHWPDGYINHESLLKSVLRSVILLSSTFFCKKRGTAIVWTVHNLNPHDANHPKLARFVLKRFIRQCDGLIFLSKASQNTFFEYHSRNVSNPACAVIRHGHYRTVYGEKPSREQARAKLGISQASKVLLFLGQIKPYKNVPALITSFLSMHSSEFELVVAGNPSSQDIKKALEKLAENHPEIHILLKFIPDEDVGFYMAAADLTVLPYKNILNSGTALLSLSYDVPVLVPALGSMVELQQDVGNDWVFTFTGDLKGSDLQNSAKCAEKLSGCDLSRYEWSEIAAETLALYEAALLPRQKKARSWRALFRSLRITNLR